MLLAGGYNIAYVVDAGELSTLDYVFITASVGSMTVLCMGLLIAWWREGLGALLILAGSVLLIIVTFGTSLPFVVPALVVGGLYVLSWVLHRDVNDREGRLGRLSHTIRQEFYKRRRTAP